MRVPTTDEPRTEAASFRAADAARRRLAAGERVLVRCSAGVPRSPAVAATVVALRRGVDLQAASEQVSDRRPGTDPHEAPVRRAATVYTGAT